MKNSFDEIREIAYYTSVETLFKILKSCTIFATHYRFLNDVDEIKGAIDHMHEQLSCGEGEILKNRFLAAFGEVGDSMHSESYITSFCAHTHDDGLLSMWRGYGCNDGSVALVFDYEKYDKKIRELHSSVKSPFGSVFGEVEYSVGGDHWKDSFKRLRVLLQKFADCDNEIKKNNFMEQYGGEIFKLLLSLLFGKKHNGFHEEREVRYGLLRSLPCASGSNRITNEFPVKYREDGAPYIEPPCYFDVLKKIIIGPCQNVQDQNKLYEKVCHYIHHHRELTHVGVYKSSIPFLFD